MGGDSWKIDPRDESELISAMGSHARELKPRVEQRLLGDNQPPADHWLRSLFAEETQSSDGAIVLRQRNDPSSALIEGFARAFTDLLTRFNRLPEELWNEYVTEDLQLSPEAATPETVVISFPAPPAGGAVKLAEHTILRVDGSEPERRYRLVDPLIIQPINMIALMGYQRPSDDSAVGAWHVLKEGRLPEAIAPFGDPALPSDRFNYEIYLCGELLQAVTAGSQILVRFINISPNAAVARGSLGQFLWHLSTVDGPVELDATEMRVDGRDLIIVLETTVDAAITTDSPTTLPQAPWIGMRLRADADMAAVVNMNFEDASISLQCNDRTINTIALNKNALDTSAAFTPFGAAPAPADICYFGDPELFRWPIEDLQVRWTPVEQTRKAFPVVSLDADPISRGDGLIWERFDGSAWATVEAIPENASLESASGALGLTVNLSGLRNINDRAATEAMSSERLPGRFLRCRLQEADFGLRKFEQDQLAFQQQQIGLVEQLREDANQGLVDRAKGIGRSKKPIPLPLPPIPPVSPVFARLSVNCRTHFVSLFRDDAMGMYAGPARLQPKKLQPDFHARVFPLHWPSAQSCGFLIMGLQGVAPGGDVSCYMQIKAHPEHRRIRTNMSVHWLNGDHWHQLDAIDETFGLSQSGYLRFHCPEDLHPSPSPVDLRAIEGDESLHLYWFCLKIDRPQTAGRIAQISFNCVEAEGLVGEAEQWAGQDLKVGSQLTLELSVSGASAATVVGNHAASRRTESRDQFHERAAGITRHRHRALAPWDVERLVKNRFPDVALVRCLRPDVDHVDRAGVVRLVAVADVPDRFPMLNPAFRERIEDFVNRFSAHAARVEVIDPTFLEVRVVASLQLVPGVMADTAMRRLNEHLAAFIHPVNRWGGEQDFDKPLMLSHVESFLHGQPEVKSVVSITFGGPRSRLPVVSPQDKHELITSAESHQLSVLPS